MVSGNEAVPVTNRTMELEACRDQWTFDEKFGCWCLEDILYTARADVPKFQRLSIFVPGKLMHADGIPTEESRHVPVVFENNAAGYMQMPHTWLGGPRCYAEQYLEHGLIYVTCGCLGRESRDAQGRLVGKAPVTLVDLKMAIRFLRHNRKALPGDLDRIISVGWSAGGAMSTLLGVTGDHPRYDRYLEEAGAFMDESDAVYASQIYCPIIDLEHADLAYEWCFGADAECEDSPAGPAEIMTPFKKALSRQLAGQYVRYVNQLALRHPQTEEVLKLNADGRSGSFYDFQMECISDAATEFLRRLAAGSLPQTYSVEDYLSGRYTYEVPARMPAGRNPGLHHAGPDVGVPVQGAASRPMSLGDLVSRPPRGVAYVEEKREMVLYQGKDKHAWLSWDGQRATVRDLDAYVLNHRRRMKPCTSFDKLEMDSGENQEFGTPEKDYVHFNADIGEAMDAIAADFPLETAQYRKAFDVGGDPALKERMELINPMKFIGSGAAGHPAAYYRIRVGASDADTSLSIAMTLAIVLANAGHDVDYALVWDQPHSEADYPGKVLEWIDRICK